MGSIESKDSPPASSMPCAGLGADAQPRQPVVADGQHGQTKGKTAEGALAWDELERAQYPTFFTATFDHGATGEGRTMGLTMRYAHSFRHLRDLIQEDFGGYFAGGAQVALGLVVSPGALVLLSKAALEMIDVLNGDTPGSPFNFRYTAQIHQNYS